MSSEKNYEALTRNRLGLEYWERVEKSEVINVEGGINRLKDDMISKLPDTLISEILFYLPTKEAVRTSVLSKRWSSVWLFIPGLDLDSCALLDYNAFSSFINMSLDFSREEKLCLHKLKLSIHKDENENHCVTRWIDFVARRKLKHLDVECFVKPKCLEVKLMPLGCLEVIPVSLFVCQTLLYLRLRRVFFTTSFEESSLSLPFLKTLRLEQNVYSNETSLESLISYCPVIEDLTIVRRVDDNLKCLRVCSQTLTSLCFKLFISRSKDDKEVDIHLAKDSPRGYFIDSPRLKYLNIQDDRFLVKTITNSGSLIKVTLLGYFYLDGFGDQFYKFFTNFSGVRDLNLCIGPAMFFLEMVPYPQFCNLSHFEVTLLCFYLDKLLRFLPSCPNLRTLILHLSDSWEKIRLSSVKLCLFSSLEFVEIECEFRRYPNLELVSNPQDTGSASDRDLFHVTRKFRRTVE